MDVDDASGERTTTDRRTDMHADEHDAGENTPDETAETEVVEQVDPASDAPTEPATTATPPPAEPAATPVTAAASAPAARDHRGMLVGAGVALVIVLAFVAGLAIGTGHDDDRREERLAAMYAAGGGPGEQQGRRGGGPGGMQGREGGGPGGTYGREGGGRGEMGGPGGGPRGGVMGVVDSASDQELVVESLRGGEQVTVTIDDDTRIVRQGDAGPGDIEEADASDIGEGDIVAVHAQRDGDAESDADDEDRQVAADAVMILRAGSE
jgi:hypothetical protein